MTRCAIHANTTNTKAQNICISFTGTTVWRESGQGVRQGMSQLKEVVSNILSCGHTALEPIRREGYSDWMRLLRQPLQKSPREADGVHDSTQHVQGRRTWLIQLAVWESPKLVSI
jgi:hypothetical protein